MIFRVRPYPIGVRMEEPAAKRLALERLIDKIGRVSVDIPMIEHLDGEVEFRRYRVDEFLQNILDTLLQETYETTETK